MGLIIQPHYYNDKEVIMANERQCICCGKTYQYCRVCPSYSNLEPWHSIFDNADCMQIFHICTNYVDGKFSADEAKIRLEKLKMPSKLTNNIQKNIDEIYGKVSKEVVQPIIEPTSETLKPTEVQPSPVMKEPKVEEVSTEVPEEPKSEETSAEQPSVIKGFRKRRLERQKKNEEI